MVIRPNGRRDLSRHRARPPRITTRLPHRSVTRRTRRRWLDPRRAQPRLRRRPDPEARDDDVVGPRRVTALIGMVPHWRAHRVRFGAGLVFGLAGIGGSLLGSHWNSAADPDVLLLAFAGLMFVAAYGMWRRLAGTAAGDAVTIPIPRSLGGQRLYLRLQPRIARTIPPPSSRLRSPARSSGSSRASSASEAASSSSPHSCWRSDSPCPRRWALAPGHRHQLSRRPRPRGSRRRHRVGRRGPLHRRQPDRRGRRQSSRQQPLLDVAAALVRRAPDRVAAYTAVRSAIAA